MFRKCAKYVVALLAAAATTFVLFSIVANLADGDRALLLAAKQAPTLAAGGNAPVVRKG